MVSINYNQTANSFGRAIVIAGLLANVTHVFENRTSDALNKDAILQSPYKSNSLQESFDTYRNPITMNYNSAPDWFENEVGNFYKALLSRQEPLGSEFEAILHENLWDLYES
jgi:hypothetical protein